MPDRVTISNAALAACGCSVRIADPNDNSKEAAELRAAWDLSRLATLRAGRFNCSIKRVALPALAANDAPADEIFPFERAFKIPSEALRLVELLEAGEQDKWVQEQGRILTNLAAPLRASIVVDVKDCSLWDASLADAMAQRIGWQIADNLTGDRARKADCWNAWEALVGIAKGVDAVENAPQDHAESSWISSRFGC